jgi:sporulation protein YlmC with PRC-barrel domain
MHMRKKLQIFGSAIISCYTLGFAAPADSGWSAPDTRLGLLKQTSVLLGKKVKDGHQSGVGKIQEFLFDLPSGRVVATLVGSGSTLVPIPAHAYSFVSADKILLGVDRKLCDAAPRLTSPAGQALWQTGELQPSFAHFNFGELTPAAGGGFRTAGSLLGMRMVGRQHEVLGQLKDIMVDLPLGRVVYLVVEPAGALGVEDILFVVPPQCAQLDAASGALVLGADRAHFLAGPHFQKTFWSDLAFPDLAAAVRKHYSAAASEIPAAVPVVLRTETRSVPAVVTSRSDREITQAIMAEIVNKGKGFVTLDVSITAINGHVTLGGAVKNESQRKQVVAAAERIAGAGNVEDNLGVGPKKRERL